VVKQNPTDRVLLFGQGYLELCL